MALKYIDSCGDHYTAGQSSMKWTSAGYNALDGNGVHGNCMKGVFGKGMLFGSTTIIMEAYIRCWSILAGAFFGVGDTNGNGCAGCGMGPNGSVQVSTYGGPNWHTAPDLVRLYTWYHIGWKVHVHESAGSMELRLNGAEVLNITGIQTTFGAYPTYWSGAIGAFYMGSVDNAVLFDDLVVMDDVDDGLDDPRLPGGGGFDKFIGPVEIRVKRPNGVGLSTEWTPSPAVANYSNVDDIEGDEDATVNGATPAQVGASDIFAMENLAVGEDVLAVQSHVLARKTEEGVAALAILVNQGGIVTAGTPVYQPSTYSYVHQIEPTCPDGQLWNKARWDAMQYGYRRIV